jgi:hypothetical protein
MNAKTTPDAEYLRARLDYNMDTGLLTWRDFEKAHKRWRGRFPGTQAGSITDRGYAVVRIDDKLYRAHRIIYKMMKGEDPPNEIDHIDGNRANNKWNNLRCATAAENHQNGHSNNRTINKSLERNVIYDRRDARYYVRVTAHGVTKSFGGFDCPNEAAEAAKKARALLHGRFAIARNRKHNVSIEA